MNLRPGMLAFFRTPNVYTYCKLWSKPFTNTVDFTQTGVDVDVGCSLLIIAIEPQPSPDDELSLGRNVLVAGGGTWGWTVENALRDK